MSITDSWLSQNPQGLSHLNSVNILLSFMKQKAKRFVIIDNKNIKVQYMANHLVLFYIFPDISRPGFQLTHWTIFDTFFLMLLKLSWCYQIIAEQLFDTKWKLHFPQRRCPHKIRLGLYWVYSFNLKFYDWPCQ